MRAQAAAEALDRRLAAQAAAAAGVLPQLSAFACKYSLNACQVGPCGAVGCISRFDGFCMPHQLKCVFNVDSAQMQLQMQLQMQMRIQMHIHRVQAGLLLRLLPSVSLRVTALVALYPALVGPRCRYLGGHNFWFDPQRGASYPMPSRFFALSPTWWLPG
jgi:hypothetical protein